jgi:hypothetical protein
VRPGRRARARPAKVPPPDVARSVLRADPEMTEDAEGEDLLGLLKDGEPVPALLCRDKWSARTTTTPIGKGAVGSAAAAGHLFMLHFAKSCGSIPLTRWEALASQPPEVPRQAPSGRSRPGGFLPAAWVGNPGLSRRSQVPATALCGTRTLTFPGAAVQDSKGRRAERAWPGPARVSPASAG